MNEIIKDWKDKKIGLPKKLTTIIADTDHVFVVRIGTEPRTTDTGIANIIPANRDISRKGRDRTIQIAKHFVECWNAFEKDGLALLKQQPPASEFTKKIYEKWSPAPKHTKDPRLTLSLIDLLEACDRLDRAEASLKAKDGLLFAYESVNAPINPLLAINKDLLEACEAMQLRIAFIGMPSEPMNENCPDWSREIALSEAAIAKARKEGGE